MTHRAVLVLVLALACAGSVGAGGGWEDAHAHTVETDFALPEFVKTFVGRNDVLRALHAGDPPPRPRSKGSMVTSCDELGGIGNLSSTTDPCVIPPNTTTALTPGTWILGSGSLTMSPNASIGCDVPGCLFTVLLGGTLRVTERAMIHGGYVNVTAAAVEIVGVDASIDADGSADPTERRGWRSGDENRRASSWDPHAGAGFGGEGASCPVSSSTLPMSRGGPGYAYYDFVVNGAARGAPPPISGTSAGDGWIDVDSDEIVGLGGAGGGRVVLVTRSLRFGGGGVISARGTSPASSGAGSLGGGSGGSVVVYAEAVTDDVGLPAAATETVTEGGVSGQVLAGGGGGGTSQDGSVEGVVNGGGGGGGRIALLAPAVWPPSVLVAAGGGRSGGTCGDSGFNGAAGTVVNYPSGSLTVSNARGAVGKVGSVPSACLEQGAWGVCATTRLTGSLPTQGFNSLLIKSGAVACTDACPGGGQGDGEAWESRRSYVSVGGKRALLGGGDSPSPTPGAGGVVHVEVSSAITLTGAAHLLHGDPASPRSAVRDSATSSVTLWLVAPAVTVTDRSTLRVVGRLSVDGGPTGGGSLIVKGSSTLTVAPKPPDASSYVFNVDTVEVSDGSALEVTGGGSLSVLGRVADRGSVTVGDADADADYSRVDDIPESLGRSGGGNSVLSAGALIVDRFALVLVNRRGVIKAAADSTGDDKCSSSQCPAYVYGSGVVNNGEASADFDGVLSGVDDVERSAGSVYSNAIPCQTGRGSPFSLQMCHCVDVVVGDGGVIAAKAMHMYAIDTVTVSNAAAISADGTGCRAGEGEGKGTSFLGGAGGGGGYGGFGGGGFTPPSMNSSGTGTVAAGGGAYGSSDAPCDASSAIGSGGGDGAGAGSGGGGGGVVVLGTRLKPLGKLVVLDGGEVSANGGTGGDTAPSRHLAASSQNHPAASSPIAIVQGGGGGGGSGGTVVVFTRALSVDPGGRVAADGGGGGWSGGGGGGGGRVHLHWPLPLPPIESPDDDGTGGSNRSAPLGSFSARGGAGGADGGVNATGVAGSVTTIACPPGYTGLFCLRCLPGTFKDAKGSTPCERCDAIPPRAVYADTGRPSGPGATSSDCPYTCVGDGSLRMPDCVTRGEAAVNAVGGPIAAAAVCAALAVTLALPATLVHARVASAVSGDRSSSSRWRRRRLGGSRRRFGAGKFTRSSPRNGGGSGDRLEGGYGSGGEGDPQSQPFLQSLSEVIDVESVDVTKAFLARVYFTGTNRYRDPWRLPATPPAAVRPLLRADEWNQLVRACLLGAPPSWGTPLEGGQGGAGQGGGGTRSDGSYAGARHSGPEGTFHAFLAAACPPLASWLLARARRRTAAAVALLVDHYDRRCLRSARARALQEGLTFGCSDDATSAWLDVFVQGDEEEGAVSASLLASATGTGTRAGSPGGDDATGLESLATRLPMPVVFSGDGSYESPWRWGGVLHAEDGDGDQSGDASGGENLPLELLRVAAPDETLDPVLAGLRSRLRACRRVPRQKRGARSLGGARDDATEAGDTRRAAEDGTTSFTFALDDRRDSSASSNSPDSPDDVFAACEGLDGVARYLTRRANPALRRHGVALALAAFLPEGIRPKAAAISGQFQLGLVIYALATDVDEEDEREEETTPAMEDDDDKEEEEAAADDEGSEMDVTRGLLLPPPSLAIDSPRGSPGGGADLRGAAAWAAAAATVAGSPASRPQPERLLSLRELASPSPASSTKGGGRRRSVGSPSVSSGNPDDEKAGSDPDQNPDDPATPGTGSKMNWPPMLDASPVPSLQAASARRLSFGGTPGRPRSSRRRGGGDSQSGGDGRRQSAAALQSRLPRTTLIAPDASRLASLAKDAPRTTPWHFPSRVAHALLRNGRERPAGGGSRAAVAVAVAAFVALDAVCSFAVVAQSLACDATVAALVFSAPPLALPLAPMLGAGAVFRLIESRASAASLSRAYATWTAASLIGVAVAFTADGLNAGGVDLFGGGCAGGPWSSTGDAWFVVPLSAMAVKAASARAASARAADLEARIEEDAAARRRSRVTEREPRFSHRW